MAVADTGSIEQAAQLLHSSQLAVSITGRTGTRNPDNSAAPGPVRVKLTAAGRAAVADARRAIEAAAAAVQ